MNLTTKDINNIYIKILENANELYGEAELLIKHEKYSRAFFLLQICSEELAKIPMLSRVASDIMCDKKINYKMLDKRLRNHISKNKEILTFDKIILDFDYDKIKEYSETFNDMKNCSLYTNICEDGYFKPSEFIMKQFVIHFHELVKIRLKFFNNTIPEMDYEKLGKNEIHLKCLQYINELIK